MTAGVGVLAQLRPVARGRTWRLLAELRAGRQPQWPLYAVAVMGWIILIALDGGVGGFGHTMHDHGAHTPMPITTHALGLLGMLAVMTPLITGNARYAALRAPSSYRSRVPGWVLTGWSVGWLPLLIAPAVAVVILQRFVSGFALILATTACAIAWQWTPQKRVGLARCHATVAPPLALPAARRASRRYGVSLGWNCGISCAPVMMVMVAAGHSVPVVVTLTGLAWYERRRCPHHDPRRATTVFVLVAVGVLAAIAGLDGR